MRTNLMPKIAKLLGVELGEKFKIKGYDELTYKFDNSGLKLIYNNDTELSVATAPTVFVALLSGEYEIIKLSWKPKKGDVYFSFGLSNGKWIVGLSWWCELPYEYALLGKGWVFKTRAEAEATLPAAAKEMGLNYEI